MVLDAREQPRLALPGPTRDRERFRQALEDLPAYDLTPDALRVIAEARARLFPA